MSVLLNAKAEVVLGSLLVVRNRTVQLTGGLLFAVLALLSLQGPERLPLALRPISALTIVGALAAGAGSRLLAPGAALASARQVATEWWMVAIGRCTGALLVVLPCAAVSALVLGHSESSPIGFGASAVLYAAAMTSFTCFLAPLIGSSGSLAVGFATIWFGAMPPSDWPTFGIVLHWFWDLMPLQWRALEIMAGHGGMNLMVFVIWIVAGVVAAGWSTSAVWDVGRSKARRSK